MVLSPPEGNTNQEPSPPPEIDYFGKGTASQPPVTRDLAGTESKSDDGDPPPQFDSDEEDPPWFDSDGSDSDEPPPSNNEDDPSITLENMKTNLQFVRMVEEVTLESQLSPAELRTFRNPQRLVFSPTDDKNLRLSISFYISGLDHNSSERHYASSCENIQDAFPDLEMLSYDQVKQRVSNLSGVLTWKHYMCIDSCAAFTGPFARLEECPHCHKPRYNEEELRWSNGKNKVPRKSVTTFPLGPQLQSRWRSPEMAQKMYYHWNRTRDLLEKRDRIEDFVFDDVFCGSDYLDAAENGNIKDHDTVVMLSIDGAQFYRNKKSDCWIYVWIILDLAPDQHYKIRNILPGGIIPGLNNPKHLNSFLFPV